MKHQNRFPALIAVLGLAFLTATPTLAHHEEKQTGVPPGSSDSPVPDIETPAEFKHDSFKMGTGG